MTEFPNVIFDYGSECEKEFANKFKFKINMLVENSWILCVYILGCANKDLWALCKVCWIGVKLAVLCARLYMHWNIFIIKVLNNVWYFQQPILSMICSEAYLKHNWRNCLWKKQKSTIAEDNFFNNVTNMLPSKS